MTDGEVLETSPPPRSGGTSVLKIILGVVGGGCLLIVLVIVAILLFIGGVAKKAAEKQKEMDAQPVSSVTWDEIEDKFGPSSKSTDLQKGEVWKEYKGKKIRWSGKVLGVHRILGQNTMQVQLNREANLRTIVVSDVFVVLKVGEEQKAKAMALERQAEVTFEAILDQQGVKLGHRWAIVTLIHGRIVD